MNKKPKLRRVVINIVILGVVLVLLRTTAGYWAFRQSTAAHDLLSHLYATVISLTDLQDILLDAEIGSRAYIITGAEESYVPFTNAKQAFEGQLAEISGLIKSSGPEQAKRLEELEDLARRTIAYNENVINTMKAGKHDEAVALIADSTGIQLIVDGRRKAGEMVEEEMKELNPRQESAAQADFYAMLLIPGAFFVSIFVYVFLLWYLSRQVVLPIRSVITTIASAATEIAATVGQNEKTTFPQSAAVTETTATIAELERSFHLMDEAAAAAGARANQAIVLAEDGSMIVNQSLAGIRDLKDKVSAIAEQILRRSEQTSQIGAVIHLVSDLASQTNMLALNAAVEAARAGEHGKGFAVVALEIRKLADQSRKSAEKVNTLVDDIRKAIDTSVMVTEEGTKTAAQGMELSQSTAAAFHSLKTALGSIVTNFQQTQLSINQQLTAVKQLAQPMKAGVDQLKGAIQKLGEIV